MLDELVDVIETLKSRIDEHRAVLQGNEAQTRLSLIDPLLRALGWDTADPALVRPEYVVNGRRADYALMNAQSDVVVFLEAKNLGEHLANHRSQVVAYASELGIRFPALTNGNEWEVYDNSQLVPIEQRRVLNVSIADTDSAKCALQFLLLWRPNLASGQPIGANEPILGTEPTTVSAQIAEPHLASATTVAPAQPAVQPVPSEPDSGWITLSDFIAVVKRGTPCPSKVRLPNGDERDVRSWKRLLIELAEWLIRDGALTADKCPLSRRQGYSHCLVNSQPRHPDETDIFEPHRLPNGLFLASHGGSLELVRKCRAIMDYLGKDPATVHVQVG